MNEYFTCLSAFVLKAEARRAEEEEKRMKEIEEQIRRQEEDDQRRQEEQEKEVNTSLHAFQGLGSIKILRILGGKYRNYPFLKPKWKW